MTTSKPKSWRDVLPIHPAAEMNPRMTPEDKKKLGEDIRKNGLTSAVVLWRDHDKAEAVLLDGINRLDAIEMVIGPVEVDVDDELVCSGRWADSGVTIIGPPFDPYNYVLSANIHRRHLTPEEKRDVIAKVLKETPEKSNRQIAEAVKVDHKTVASVRAEKQATGEIPQLTKTVGKDGKARKTSERAGDVSNLDTRTDRRGREQPAHKSTPPATAPKPTTDSDQPSCSFCGKGPERVSTLIVSQENHVAICNECVDLCVGVIAERKKTASHVAEAEPAPEMVECPKCHGTGNMDDDGIPGFQRRQPS